MTGNNDDNTNNSKPTGIDFRMEHETRQERVEEEGDYDVCGLTDMRSPVPPRFKSRRQNGGVGMYVDVPWTERHGAYTLPPQQQFEREEEEDGQKDGLVSAVMRRLTSLQPRYVVISVLVLTSLIWMTALTSVVMSWGHHALERVQHKVVSKVQHELLPLAMAHPCAQSNSSREQGASVPVWQQVLIRVLQEQEECQSCHTETLLKMVQEYSTFEFLPVLLGPEEAEWVRDYRPKLVLTEPGSSQSIAHEYHLQIVSSRTHQYHSKDGKAHEWFALRWTEVQSEKRKKGEEGGQDDDDDETNYVDHDGGGKSSEY